MFKHATSSQSGQVAVVVLLIMVVLLTIGLSLATRTTQELFLSDQQAESARVFNAAESGIEQALSEVQVGSGTLTVDGVDVQYNVTGSSTLDTRVTEGMSVHLDMSGYAGNVSFEWATEGACSSRASLVAMIYFDDNGTTKAMSVPFGPGCDSRSDDFTDAGNAGGNPYYHTYTIPASALPSGPNISVLFMRVKPIYADTDIRITGGIGFPTQYHVINSTATYVGGDEERSIEVSRTLPSGPSYMDYALYSGAAITQNP